MTLARPSGHPQSSPSSIDRYRDLVDDFQELTQAVSRPLPVCFWVNPARLPDGAAEDYLLRDGLKGEPLPWKTGAYRLLDDTSSFGNSLLYRGGAVHVQEAASMLPVTLLAPRAGERVLDLCAAPGNKTAQIATRVGPSGSVIANDPSRSRLGILRATVDRLGLTNVCIHIGDGRSKRWAQERFDAVLVDAPCSCEGTVRKNQRTAFRASDRPYLVRVQKALLLRAVEACRVGGRIVYATCTFAPEENEAVVDEVLSAFAGKVRIEPADVPGLSLEMGIETWKGQSYSQEIRHCRRLWPHAHDGGGFFAAVIRKTAPTAADEQSPADGRPDEHDAADSADWKPAQDLAPPTRALFAFLGIEDAQLSPYLFKADGRILLMRNRQFVGAISGGADRSGIALAKLNRRAPAPTTAGALVLKPLATRQCINLSRADAMRYLNQQTLDLSGSPMKRGPVIVSSAGVPLGHAFFDGDWQLRSGYPRNWAGLNPPAAS